MLPIIADLLPDESLDSWIEYLVDLNACRPRDITGTYDLSNYDRAVPFTRNANAHTLETIATNTGVPVERLRHATMRRYENVGLAHTVGHCAGEGAWSHVRGSRFCPECLQAGNLRWKLAWHLRWVTVCDTHRTVLADYCPACGSRARDARVHHPRTASSPVSAWRLARCPYACSTETLAASAAHQIEIDSAAYRAHQWLTTVLDTGGAVCAYAGGEYLTAKSILSDAAPIVRAALNAMTYVDGVGTLPGGSDPGSWTRQLTAADFVRTSAGRTGAAAVTTPQFLLALTAAVEILTTATGPKELAGTWLTPSRIKKLGNHLARSKSARPTVHLLRLLGRKPPTGTGTAVTDRIGRRRPQHSAKALYSAVSDPIDAMNLPTNIWPAVCDHAPAMVGRVARNFPLTAPIALATMGRRVDYALLAAEFGHDLAADEVRGALNHLVSNELGTAVFNYLCQLHAHLKTCPPPIDYRRRRRLFPTPAAIGRNHTRQLARAGGMYLTDAFTWKIQRYVWQLLTGNDPLVTHGAQLLHGPAAYSYRKFVQTMPEGLRDAAGEVAARLLLKHRIGEPVTYTPEYNDATQSWSPHGREQRFLETIGRTDLRRTSLSLRLAASAAGDVEELVHLACAGEKSVALKLCRLADTAHCPTHGDAAALYGIRSTQIGRESVFLSRALGADIFTPRTRSAPRTLTAEGTKLYNLARANIDRLSRIAEYTGPFASPPDYPKSSR
ncbi:TniQ family protein [Tomitella cavernea]|uniref:TniQ domain-containing protein n=1 Tax=Tomitella cavernea TaxID=1387982 RepID=A0ABP9D4K4_9ACTN|nr:TniQ family protein [Tomitella cavernea]